MLGGMWHRLGQNPRKFFSSISCLSILCKSEDLELHFHHQHGGNKSNLQFLLSELKCIKNLNRSSDDWPAVGNWEVVGNCSGGKRLESCKFLLITLEEASFFTPVMTMTVCCAVQWKFWPSLWYSRFSLWTRQLVLDNTTTSAEVDKKCTLYWIGQTRNPLFLANLQVKCSVSRPFLKLKNFLMSQK